MRHRRPLLFSAAVVLSMASMMVSVGAAPAPGPGPALQESVEALAQTLSCPATFQGKHEPVLLVHATAETGVQFLQKLRRVLPKMGYDVCTVELVDYARGDIQASAEGVVHAIRTIAQRSQRKVQVIGHSEGPLPVRWAIKWWPDDVSYTSVYTITDELVQPYTTAELQGGANIKVQDVCPGRVGEHYEMVYDAVVYAVVLDALTHPGPADLTSTANHPWWPTPGRRRSAAVVVRPQ